VFLHSVRQTIVTVYDALEVTLCYLRHSTLRTLYYITKKSDRQNVTTYTPMSRVVQTNQREGVLRAEIFE